MSIIKGRKDDGEEVTCVQPNSETLATVMDLQKRGYKGIHNPQTGEWYDKGEVEKTLVAKTKGLKDFLIKESAKCKQNKKCKCKICLAIKSLDKMFT